MGSAICSGVGKWYLARTRDFGCRKWDALGKSTKSYRIALSRMNRAFATGKFKRADVIMGADYYDPLRLVQLVRYD
jgi:hypothetical protein